MTKQQRLVFEEVLTCTDSLCLSGNDLAELKTILTTLVPTGSIIGRIQAALAAQEKQYAATKVNTPEWWTIGGYAGILHEALEQIARHERRAKRVYGDRAPGFLRAIENVTSQL